MLHRGDFGPLIQGDITAEHFETDAGKIVHNFITGYVTQTDREARYPSLGIIRNRFTNLELPDPDPGDDLRALVHETVMMKTKADLRRIATDLQTISMNSDNPHDALPGILGSLKKLTDAGQRSKHLSLSGSFNEILENYDYGAILPNGIPWPWPALNDATKGMQRKEFVVLAGRPKSRKTFVALCVATYAMKHHHARVLVFTPEMPRMQIMLRIVSFLSGIHYAEFKNSKLDDAEHLMLLESAKSYAKLTRENEHDYHLRLKRDLHLPSGIMPSIDVVESTGKTVSWMEAQIEMYRPDIVICDSFYRQAPENTKKSDADWKAMTAISRSLKDLAMTTNTCIIGTHQMNRGAEGQIGTLSNMALADAIGQDADVIFRIITQTVQGMGRSAIIVLGGREVPFDGIFINNEPCYDYSQVGVITSKQTIVKWLKEDDNAAAEEEAKETLKHRNTVPGQRPKNKAAKDTTTYGAAQATVNTASMDEAATAIDEHIEDA